MRLYIAYQYFILHRTRCLYILLMSGDYIINNYNFCSYTEVNTVEV